MRPLAVLSLLLVAAPLLAEPKKYALLVGVNKYEHADLSKLDYAEADVTDLKKLLDKGGYQTVLLAGKDATLANIRKELDALRKNARGAGVVTIALAGHGIQLEMEKEAYFCPVDASQKLFDRNGKKVADWDLEKTMLPISEVIANLKGSGAEAKALFVDACRNDPKTGRGRGFATNFNVGDLPDNLAVMLSCSRGEKAWEDAKWGHGAFFYHVLQGLNGKAAIEGHVSANTLAGYVKRAVKNDVSVVVGGGAAQNPHTIINGEVDFLIKPTVEPPEKPMIAAEKGNPYRKSKLGDYSTYKSLTKVGTSELESSMTITVTAKDEKEVTLTTISKVNGTETPASETKIDLSTPTDPLGVVLPPGSNVKAEQLKNGTEVIKLRGKDYTAKWQTYKLKIKTEPVESDGEMKIWTSDRGPIPFLKLEMSIEINGNKMQMFMELTDSGNKSE